MSVVINGSAGVTTNSGAVYNGIQAGTAVASTSGTSIDFTSIPSWVKRITVMFAGVSTNGTSNLLVQLGAGSVTSSGYISTCVRPTAGGTTQGASSTSGMISYNGSASNVNSGSFTLSLVSSNVWVSTHLLKLNTTDCSSGGGDVTLGNTLDRIRITTVNGTDTFDAGSINILYE